MCGIFGLLNNKQTFNDKIIKRAFENGKPRGPEYSKIACYSEKLILGCNRLAINGMNELSNQPLTIGNVTLICNGEIYNYTELHEIMGIKSTTGSDCEVIIRMYKKYGFEYTLEMLDGEFALILVDTSDMSSDPIIYVARDPFGVRPLYVLEVDPDFIGPYNSPRSISENDKKVGSNDCIVTTERIIAFASELKMLAPLLGTSGEMKLCQNDVSTVPINRRICANQKTFVIKPFSPGTFSSYSKTFLVNSEWESQTTNKCFFKVSPPKPLLCEQGQMATIARQGIFNHLDNAVKKRVIGTTERPIACLLSGDINSSIIAALVNKYHTSIDKKHRLQTFSIGISGSEDVKQARDVAQFLGTNHTEIIFQPDELFDAIPDVIKIIESYDTETVRASVCDYLICKYISENTDAKVIFNGNGSDEVTGGYLYFLKAPNDFEFDKECRRLLSDIHTFDILRYDRCVCSNGLEPRSPFLDKTFVDYYLSLPIELRNPDTKKYSESNEKCEKYLLRKAIFENAPSLLPQHIIWRTKEISSDGISSASDSWVEFIQKKVKDMKFDIPNSWRHNVPQTLEQTYYRTIYESFYPGTAQTIPYFWMPKFVKANDCSARTLEIYSERENKNKNVFGKIESVSKIS
jgi:asparagine synthase (glutamine-hydrolysing)